MPDFLAYNEDVVRGFLGRKSLSPAGHAGLIWDRYFPVWEWPSDPLRRSKLHEPLDTFVAAFNQRGQGPRNPARDLVRQHRERLLRAVEGLVRTRGRSIGSPAFRVAGRLVTGLGADHPTGNGFAFDPVIGVPYIPGTLVKGLCRRSAELGDISASEIARLFGPEQDGPRFKGEQGRLSFFGAYPKRWPKLVVDVVNCHHPRYYADLGRRAQSAPFPRETENPVPVFFLAVEAGTEFVFPMVARNEADLNTGVGLLRQGLDLLGIGAKTAVGYGFMEEVEPKGSRRPAG